METVKPKSKPPSEQRPIHAEVEDQAEQKLAFGEQEKGRSFVLENSRDADADGPQLLFPVAGRFGREPGVETVNFALNSATL